MDAVLSLNGQINNNISMLWLGRSMVFLTYSNISWQFYFYGVSSPFAARCWCFNCKLLVFRWLVFILWFYGFIFQFRRIIGIMWWRCFWFYSMSPMHLVLSSLLVNFVNEPMLHSMSATIWLTNSNGIYCHQKSNERCHSSYISPSNQLKWSALELLLVIGKHSNL